MLTLSQYADLKNFLPYYQSGKISSSFIATHLGVSTQHVRRLMNGSLCPKSRTAHNQLPNEIKQFIITEKQSYPFYNCQWLSEIAGDRFGRLVSQSSVHRILSKADLLHKEPINRKPRTRFEVEHCGDLVQMDTTWGYWVGGRKICLTVLLDDHSRYILLGTFTWHDTASWNMDLIRIMVGKYGAPKTLYTDNASFFKAIRHNQSRFQNHTKSEYESEITRACREVGITHITHRPYQPQGKGKIERLFRFIQERFIPLIDDNSTLEAINWEFDSWVDWYNKEHRNRTTNEVPEKRFSLEGFKPLSDTRSLSDIFCFKDTRKVDKCNQFSYQGQVYSIPKKYCMVAYRVNLNIRLNESIRVWHDDKFICELPITSK